MPNVMEKAPSLQERNHGDVASMVSDRDSLGLFDLEAGHRDQSLLPPKLRITLDQVKIWYTNDLIGRVYELTTVSVLVAMSATSMLHQFSKLRSVPRALWRARRARGGSVIPMCSFCLAMATEEWTQRHDKDCPWQREDNRCARCGYVTWWEEFLHEEQCPCKEEGMIPDV